MSSYDKENKYYRVIYEDDDSEEYTVSELVKLIEGENPGETDTHQGRPRAKPRRTSAKARKSTGGHVTCTRDSKRRSTSRKVSPTTDPVQKTANKARPSATTMRLTRFL